MKENEEEKRKIDMDERGNPLMTLRTLKYYCLKDRLYETPELNEKLCLSLKGFRRISSLEHYPNLATIWLNNNCISQIEGLDSLKNLLCLNLNNNAISVIENLEGLPQLQVLNLAHNKIDRISGLSPLKNLHTFNISENFLTDVASIQGLSDCPTISNLNMNKNEIECSEELFRYITTLYNLSCLYLKATPLSRGFKNYRKRLTAELRYLKFLDDRPIQPIDHRLAEAWVKGGPELEKEERQKIADEKDDKGKRQSKELQEKLSREWQRNQEVKELTLEKAQLQKGELTSQTQERIQQIERRLEVIQDGPKGFQAEVTPTSVKVLGVPQQDQEKVINKYFYNEKKEVEANLQKLKHSNTGNMVEVDAEQQQRKIEEKVRESMDLPSGEAKAVIEWDPKYEKLLEALLEKHKFDFWEVQPQLNMILAEINKKMVRPHRRFEVSELQRVWTEVERRRRG